MKTLLTLLLILSGIVFVIAVMLMSPKGGLGLGIGGSASSSNEYGSKKSIEHTLKRTALIAGIIFCVTALFLPYSN
jgi:protein translocase SecG subunit